MVPAEELTRLAGEAVVVLLHVVAALAHLREGDVPTAIRELSEVIAAAPAPPAEARYAEEALYWRARIAQSMGTPEELRSAARDYLELLARLPDGRLRRQVRVRLAELAEPGKLMSEEEARKASARRLERIGRALHDYAVDHGLELPRALEDLLDGYISDPSILVRPGPVGSGGGRAYAYFYTPRADLKPQKGELPIVVAEPVASAQGERLALRLDGQVVTLRSQQTGR